MLKDILSTRSSRCIPADLARTFRSQIKRYFASILVKVLIQFLKNHPWLASDNRTDGVELFYFVELLCWKDDLIENGHTSPH